MPYIKDRDPNFTYNLEVIKKVAIEEISANEEVEWYKFYFNFENYRIGNLGNKEKDQFQTLGVDSFDSFDRLSFDLKVDDPTRILRHTIRLSDLTDEERKDLFDTIKTACDAVSL